jgi:predicted peptidase
MFLPRPLRSFFRLKVLLATALALLAVQLAWPTIIALWNTPRPGKQVPAILEQSVAQQGPRAQIAYWVYLPDEYGSTPSKPWPLLLFLHGAGDRGDDLERVKHNGPPALIDEGRQFPMIVISPQCPAGGGWQAQALLALVEHIAHKFRVDPDRVYVTGFSMGGYGTWELAAADPGRFAAIVPVAGGGDASNAGRLKDMPIWAFHGALDDSVPLSSEQAMVDAVRAEGGNVKFTIFPDKGHGICNDVYQNPEVYDWLLLHKRHTRQSAATARDD